MSKKIMWIHLLLLAVTCLVYMSVLNPYGAATTPDSLQYLNIAQTLKQGFGYHSSVHYLTEETLRLSQQRSWPPLYPLVLVLLPEVNSFWVAIASTILLYLSVVSVYAILQLMGHNQLMALLLALLLLLQLPVITVYTFAWSETLFLTLLLISIFIMGKIFQTEVLSARGLISLTIVLIALAYTRYIGAVFFLNFAILFYIYNGRISRIKIFAAGLVAVSCFGILLWNNWTITGYLSGVERQPSQQGWWENTYQSYEVLQLAFGSPICLILFGVLMIFAWKSRENEQQKKHGLKNLLPIIGINAVVYTAAIIILRAQSGFDQIDIRLLSPALVLLYLFIAILVVVRVKTSKYQKMAAVVAAILLVPAIYEGLMTLKQIPDNWKTAINPGLKMDRRYAYNNFTRNDVAEKLMHLLPKEAVLISDRARIIDHITGRKTYQLLSDVDEAILFSWGRLPKGSSFFITDASLAKKILSRLNAMEIKFRYVEIAGSILIQPIFAKEQ